MALENFIDWLKNSDKKLLEGKAKVPDYSFDQFVNKLEKLGTDIKGDLEKAQEEEKELDQKKEKKKDLDSKAEKEKDLKQKEKGSEKQLANNRDDLKPQDDDKGDLEGESKDSPDKEGSWAKKHTSEKN